MLSILLALLSAASMARGQPGTAMVVSATVVNTCFFGVDARCARPGTSLVQTSERVTASETRVVRRRVVHL